ncbi:copper resistance CopC family protein [Microbacterium immunditiarum]|uniref:CopC domain-containing protein n=1 Tax=Microbacterium immunditiarum TaxID=337480 RepID=A0A7Y9GMS7_9MICO|nr:copper resistance CopC family protein [Microbacterium immunditiarum]NYE19367.1 hypothetical protein [Microbacterium immunditiarum]
MPRVRSVLAGAAVALAAVLASAAPAAAHDALAASDPAPDERLDAAPESVSLTFTGSVLTMGAAVVVADESGRDWVAGEPEVVEGTVSVPLEPGMPEAAYEVRWRVVSADGHAISGLIPFTIGDAEPFSRTADAAQAEADAAVGPPSQNARNAPEQQSQSAAEDQGGALRVVLVGIGGAVAAIAVYALVTLLRRRTSAAGDSP